MQSHRTKAAFAILLQGGLEIPCDYILKAKNKFIDKLITLLMVMKFELVDSCICTESA